MKSIEFNEEQLKDLAFIGKQLFEDEKDPRSVLYSRSLNRPKIHWFNLVCFILFSFAFFTVIAVILNQLRLHILWNVLIIFTIVLLYIILFAKRIVLFIIKLYQRLAPAAVRNKCRFEPSCSEYARLSIEKYGLIKGIPKAIDRMKRCNINGGGFDFP